MKPGEPYFTGVNCWGFFKFVFSFYLNNFIFYIAAFVILGLWPAKLCVIHRIDVLCIFTAGGLLTAENPQTWIGKKGTRCRAWDCCQIAEETKFLFTLVRLAKEIARNFAAAVDCLSLFLLCVGQPQTGTFYWTVRWWVQLPSLSVVY